MRSPYSPARLIAVISDKAAILAALQIDTARRGPAKLPAVALRQFVNEWR